MPTTKLTDAKSELASDKASASKPSSATKRHSKFYFDNTLIVIQIEDTLFNVHKYQLIKSKTFSDMFNKPKKDSDQSKEGSSPEHPIVIEGVKVSDFEALLTVLYAAHFSAHQPAPEALLIIPSFRLANKWKFWDLRTCLIPLTEKVLDDVDKIAFSREFNVKDWLTPAHVRLCQRSEQLTKAEATKLGIDSLLMISRVREEFPPSKSSSNQVQSCSGIYCSRCSNSGYYGSSYGNAPRHCGGCTVTNRPTPANITTTIEEKVKKWVENNCAFTD